MGLLARQICYHKTKSEILSHNNEGIPEVRVELAKKYCHEVNERIESYLAKK